MSTTILVIEDQADIAQMTSELLRENGFEVLAPDIDSVHQTIMDHPGGIDIVVSDWSFDEHDFVDLVTKARAQHLHLHTLPCVITTGICAGNHHEIHKRLGEIDLMPLHIIHKPYHHLELIEVIQSSIRCC